MLNVCVAITGASGSLYALRLIEELLKKNSQVSVIISTAARMVLNTETVLKMPSKATAQAELLSNYFSVSTNQLEVYAQDDWMSPWASGRGKKGAMVVCPCTMGMVSAVATGASNNLMERAADVALKEHRPLILVPRESPFSTVHLKNMYELSQMGAVILPACPGFYQKPKDIDDLVDFVVVGILNQLGIDHCLDVPWGEK